MSVAGDASEQAAVSTRNTCFSHSRNRAAGILLSQSVTGSVSRQVFRTVPKGRSRRRNAKTQLPTHFPPRQPSTRSAATRDTSTWRRGRPSRLPLARAAAMPDRMRSRISSRSNSAMLAKIPKMSRPFGVDVSTPSWSESNWMPSASNSPTASTSAADFAQSGHIGERRPRRNVVCDRHQVARRAAADAPSRRSRPHQ